MLRSLALVALGADIGIGAGRLANHAPCHEGELLRAAELGQMIGRVQHQTARFSEACPVAWQLGDPTGRC